MIVYDQRKGLTQEQCVESLRAAFGDQAPSRATVFRWFSQCKWGPSSLDDEPRSGRPASAVTDDNIAAVRRMIDEDRRVTCAEIREALGIGSAAVTTILHDKLGASKRCARWVPHNLTEDQKAERVRWCEFMLERFKSGTSKRCWEIITGDETWVYQYDPETKQQSAVWLLPDDASPTKVRRARSVGKQMVATFFSQAGHLATVALQDRRTVNADWYINQCLPLVFDAWRRRRPRTGLRGLLLHHDNASAHTAAATLAFLAENGVQLVTHPAYSPDLVPCDFFLFPLVKNQLRGTRFESPEAARIEFERVVSAVPEEQWAGAWTQWFHRMKKCVQACGNYFEKL